MDPTKHTDLLVATLVALSMRKEDRGRKSPCEGHTARDLITGPLGPTQSIHQVDAEKTRA